ncbi:hypothetical protein GF371_04830 [Candidatus Woesearchaeota archaeon]|nr:hypothetical protein [Candidatus Woesearchaeota archaeon]
MGLLKKIGLAFGATTMGALSLGAAGAHADEPAPQETKEEVKDSQYRFDFSSFKSEYERFKQKREKEKTESTHRPEGMDHSTYETRRTRLQRWRRAKNATFQAYAEAAYRREADSYNSRIGIGKFNPAANDGILGRNSTWQIFGQSSRGSNTPENRENVRWGAGAELSKTTERGRPVVFGINAGGDAGNYGGKGKLYVSAEFNSKKGKKTPLTARLTFGGEGGVDTTETRSRGNDLLGNEINTKTKTRVTQGFGQANLDVTGRFNGGSVTVSGGGVAGRVDSNSRVTVRNSSLYGPAFGDVTMPDIRNRIDIAQGHAGATVVANNDFVGSAFYIHNRTFVDNEDPNLPPEERRTRRRTDTNTGVFNLYGNVGKWLGMRPNLWIGGRATVSESMYEGGGSIILSNVGKDIVQESSNPTNSEDPARALRRAAIANDFNWALQLEGAGGRNEDTKTNYGRVQGTVTAVPNSTIFGKVSLNGGYEQHDSKIRALSQRRGFVGAETTFTNGTSLYGQFEYIGKRAGKDDIGARVGARQYFTDLVLE